MSMMRDILGSMCRDFFKGCFEERDFDLTTNAEDSSDVRRVKSLKTKKLIERLLNGIMETLVHEQIPE